MNTKTHEPPTASVLMPVYNAELYIEAAVASVLAQTFQDFELLLLNDGSTDSTLQKLEKFAAQDTRCKIISGPNVGIVATLNKGLALAQGALIFRMDADDICLPTRFQEQMDYMAQHPECALLGSSVYLIDDAGRRILELHVPIDHLSIDKANMQGAGSHIYHPTWLLRSSVIAHIGGYREVCRHAEDLDFLLRLAEVGELHNLASTLVLYRQHAASIGYARRNEQVAATRRAVTEACQRRGLPPPQFAGAQPANAAVLTVAAIHAKWAWWALRGANKTTARHHALKAFAHAPWNWSNIKLLAAALRGY